MNDFYDELQTKMEFFLFSFMFIHHTSERIKRKGRILRDKSILPSSFSSFMVIHLTSLVKDLWQFLETL